MHHYPHHIGDFNNSTRHLTRLERSVYRDLIDLYYDTESPLTGDVPALCRRIIATSPEEATAVEQVLNEFFTRVDSCWRHARCDIEISKFHGMKIAKSEAGKASAAKRCSAAAKETVGEATPVEQNPTAVEQVLLTKNQEPRTKNQLNPYSPQGDGRARNSKSKDWLPSDAQRHVNRWFARRDSTPWSEKELRAWKALDAQIIADGITDLDAYYSLPVSQSPYRRRDILTLLNNWRGDMDRWRNFKPAQRSDVQPLNTEQATPPQDWQ